MEFKTIKLFVGAAVAISLGTFALPIGSLAKASPVQVLKSSGRVQIAQADSADSKTEEKTEQKTTQSTDSSGMPQADKHLEHETTEAGTDRSGAAQMTRHKAEVNESTNATGDTTKEEHHTTESSQHN
jgi:hypothetical protein